jgi:hypothetical protein
MWLQNGNSFKEKRGREGHKKGGLADSNLLMVVKKRGEIEVGKRERRGNGGIREGRKERGII